MSTTAAMSTGADGMRPVDRLEVLFDELAELSGQRNAIDGRIVEIVAELDRGELWGLTGCRSIEALVAWKLGCSPHNAETFIAIAERFEELPRCTSGMRKGRLSLDQVGVIAQRGGQGSDKHYAKLARSATVTQLRTAIKLEPQPSPTPRPEPSPGISKRTYGGVTSWKITLPNIESAKFEAGLQSHHDGLIAEWKRDSAGVDEGAGDADVDDRDDDGDGYNYDAEDNDGYTYNDDGAAADDAEDGDGDGPGSADGRAPMPTRLDALMALVECGWDVEAQRRPHGQRTTVVAHVDVRDKIASLHLGPLLADAERRYLTCDATCQVWFERHGQVIGVGRTTRTVSRRLRRALEHRDPCCAVPGCGATRGLHAHHIQHWEDGGPTDLDNLVLVCAYHHRLHHRGVITITGPAPHITVTDRVGRRLEPGSLARPPTTPPPAVPPCPGPTGERANWWWYDPFIPKIPRSNN